ncbi:MAG TPA: sigma-70 family RNA polymerase sigma factor [Phycisphaerales bacterium]|nr:sigma-70 family RNA polymerase sigma factor [Phycisphaerales bacterium]
MHTGRTTRGTLLHRVREGAPGGEADAAAWRELDDTYREMLLRFCRSRGLQHADAEDVIQQVFARLIDGLRKFEYDRTKGRFRDYLFRCARNAISDWAGARGCQNLPGAGVVPVSEVASESEWEESFRQEWVDHHFRRAMQEVEKTADAQSVEVLRATLAGRSPKEIALTLGMQEMAVYKAQQRMRDRLKARIAEQVEEEDSE